jgi:hypothetical protein
MRVRVLSKYTQVVKQSNSVSLENPTTEGDLCFGGFIRQNSDAAFARKYCVFAHKFPRNSIFSLLRIQRLLISQPTYR